MAYVGHIHNLKDLKDQVLLNSIARVLWRVRDLAGSGEKFESPGANANRHQKVARENGTHRLNKEPVVGLCLGAEDPIRVGENFQLVSSPGAGSLGWCKCGYPRILVGEHTRVFLHRLMTTLQVLVSHRLSEGVVSAVVLVFTQVFFSLFHLRRLRERRYERKRKRERWRKRAK